MFLVFFGICDFFHNLVCVRCAYFCPTYIEGGVLSGIYGWIAFAGFITFLVNFYYICGLYYILVNYCICGRMKLYTMLLSNLATAASKLRCFLSYRSKINSYSFVVLSGDF